MKTVLLLVHLNLLVLVRAAAIDQTSTTVNVQRGGQEYSYSIRETHGEVPQEVQKVLDASDVGTKGALSLLEVAKVLLPQLNVEQAAEGAQPKVLGVPEGNGQLVLSVPSAEHRGAQVPQEQSKVLELPERQEGLGQLGVPQDKGPAYPQLGEQPGEQVPRDQPKVLELPKQQEGLVPSVPQENRPTYPRLVERHGGQVPQDRPKVLELPERQEGLVLGVLQDKRPTYSQLVERSGAQVLQVPEGLGHLVLSVPQEKVPAYPQFAKHHGPGGFFLPLGFYFVPGVVRLV